MNEKRMNEKIGVAFKQWEDGAVTNGEMALWFIAAMRPKTCVGAFWRWLCWHAVNRLRLA
jgi:hypothetical protein